MTSPDLLPRPKFIQFALDAGKGEYADLYDTWKQLDSKAQGTTAIAGIFLAAALVFLKNIEPALHRSEKTAIGIIALMAGISFAFALLAMLVVEISAPRTLTSLLTEVNDLLNSEDPKVKPDEVRLENLCRDAVTTLSNAIDDIRRKGLKKASLVIIAQIFAGLAGIATIALIFVFLYLH